MVGTGNLTYTDIGSVHELKSLVTEAETLRVALAGLVEAVEVDGLQPKWISDALKAAKQALK